MIGDAMVEANFDQYQGARLSVHLADPGRTGAHEMGGGDYQQQPVQWAKVDPDGLRNVNDMVIPLVSGPYPWGIGVWSMDGRFLGGQPIARQPERTRAYNGDSLHIAPGDLTVYVLMVEE